MANPLYIAVTPETHALFVARQDAANLGSDEYVRQLLAETVTYCPHGISHQPGEPDAQARSQWCGECFPEEYDP